MTRWRRLRSTRQARAITPADPGPQPEQSRGGQHQGHLRPLWIGNTGRFASVRAAKKAKADNYLSYRPFFGCGGRIQPLPNSGYLDERVASRFLGCREHLVGPSFHLGPAQAGAARGEVVAAPGL